jgi:hypothetical protein
VPKSLSYSALTELRFPLLSTSLTLSRKSHKYYRQKLFSLRQVLRMIKTCRMSIALIKQQTVHPMVMHSHSSKLLCHSLKKMIM